MTNEELRAARKDRGFTQQEMAEALGVPVSTYRKWEQGDRKVPGLVAGQLANRKLAVKHLSVAESVDFARKVNEAGIDPDQLVADMIREWMARTITVALLCLVGWQFCKPGDNPLSRALARRKATDEGVELVAEA